MRDDFEIPHFRKRKCDRWIAKRNAHRPPRGVLKIFGSERDTALSVVLGFFFVIVLMCMAIAFLGPLVRI
jgi:hypothetical protein